MKNLPVKGNDDTMKIKKFHYSLQEAASETGIAKEELLHLAAQGEIAISVYFNGAVLAVDNNTYHLKIVGYRNELMCLTPHEVWSFLTKSAHTVTKLVDECYFKKYRKIKFDLPLDKIGYDGCGIILSELEDSGITIPEEHDDFSKFIEKWKNEWCNRIEIHSSPGVPGPIKEELFIQSGKISDFVPCTPDEPEWYDLDEKKFPLYTTDDLVISYKEMERIKGLFSINNEPTTKKTTTQVNDNPEEDHTFQPQPEDKGNKVFKWKKIQEVAGMSRPTIKKANKTVKMENIIHHNGKSVWAYESDIKLLATRHNEYIDRKSKKINANISK